MARNSRAFLFIDYGYVEDNRIDFQYKFNDLLGMGFGLRLDTKVGLLRIDYGFHYAEKQWLKPTNGIVHFGIETKL
jgi:outer membrane translocation and assembly module TamA